MNSVTPVQEYVTYNPEKDVKNYKSWDNKIASILKVVGIALPILGVILGIIFARIPTEVLIGEDTFSGSIFFVWLLSTLFGGAILLGIGELIKLQQKSLEKQELQLIHLRSLQKEDYSENRVSS